MNPQHYWRFALGPTQTADLVNNVEDSPKGIAHPFVSNTVANWGTTAHFPAVFAGTKDERWSVGYERLPHGATTLNGCVKAVCTPSRVYGTFYPESKIFYMKNIWHVPSEAKFAWRGVRGYRTTLTSILRLTSLEVETRVKPAWAGVMSEGPRARRGGAGFPSRGRPTRLKLLNFSTPRRHSRAAILRRVGASFQRPLECIRTSYRSNLADRCPSGPRSTFTEYALPTGRGLTCGDG